jgi:PKD repeat protein
VSDTRTLRQKLEAMANQVASPNEATIAARKLEELGPEPDLWDERAGKTWAEYMASRYAYPTHYNYPPHIKTVKVTLSNGDVVETYTAASTSWRPVVWPDQTE